MDYASDKHWGNAGIDRICRSKAINYSKTLQNAKRQISLLNH